MENQSPTLTLPETNSLHLEMDGWNTTFLLGRPKQLRLMDSTKHLQASGKSGAQNGNLDSLFFF